MPERASEPLLTTDTLFGALRGVHADTECAVCGCLAVRHTPCCGCCLDCGDRVCPEFEEARSG